MIGTGEYDNDFNHGILNHNIKPRLKSAGGRVLTYSENSNIMICS